METQILGTAKIQDSPQDTKWSPDCDHNYRPVALAWQRSLWCRNSAAYGTTCWVAGLAQPTYADSGCWVKVLLILPTRYCSSDEVLQAVQQCARGPC